MKQSELKTWVVGCAKTNALELMREMGRLLQNLPAEPTEEDAKKINVLTGKAMVWNEIGVKLGILTLTDLDKPESD